VRTIATEKLEVKMGAGLSPEGLTDELLETETIFSNKKRGAYSTGTAPRFF